MEENSRRKLEDYERDIAKLKAKIQHDHGPAVMQRLLREATPSDSEVRDHKNLLIVAECLLSGLSVQRFAADNAKRFKVSPKALDRRIRRVKKRKKVDRPFRQYIEALLQQLAIF